MAAADTAKLVASLTLDAKGFQRGVASAQKSLGGLESTVGNIGRRAGEGVKSFSKNIALIGVAAAGGIAIAVKGGLDSLAELESAIASVDGAIETLNLQGQLSGKEIAKWANDIERDIGAAFDDKAITAGAATLLRFGKVTPKNLKPALVVMTDLAAKTGDVESAATLLAKVLADPAKAAGKLAKQGIILTDAQEKQLKAMTDVNDVAGAQNFLLGVLTKTTAGAAEASQGKYARALSVLNDVAEDAKKALAEGFLPVIEKVADKLSTAMADPAFINGIRSFGQELAGGLDDLIGVAEKLPWSTIGDSLKLAGAGAKAVLTAFTSLPPWIQTAVITGWGLNKLTGGALGDIVGELGKGLIKGVLGINAGVVNIKAASVVGAGGAGTLGGAGTASGTAGGVKGAIGKVASAAAKVFIVGAAAAFLVELAGVRGEQAAANKEQAKDVTQQAEVFVKKASFSELKTALAGLQATNDELLTGSKAFTPAGIAYALDIDGVRTAQQDIIRELEEVVVEQALTKNAAEAQQRTAAQTLASSERSESIATQKAAELKAAVTTTGAGTATAIAGAKAATTAGLANVKAAADATKAAVIAKDLSVKIQNVVNTSLSVSVRETIKTQTTHKQYQRYLS